MGTAGRKDLRIEEAGKILVSRLEIHPGCVNQRGLQAAGAEGRLSPPYSSLIPFSDLGSQISGQAFSFSSTPNLQSKQEFAIQYRRWGLWGRPIQEVWALHYGG